MRATYNITDDRLRFYPGAERLSPENYTKVKEIGFSWWPGQKLFTCTWRPTAEDFITEVMGLEIEEEDEADNLAARVERFGKYADSAAAAVQSVEHRDQAGRLNTERRRRLALGVMERETERAEHWNRRVSAAISHAAYRDKPAVILGRIKKLEAEKRRHEKNQTESEGRRATWESVNTPEAVRRLLTGDLVEAWDVLKPKYVAKHTRHVLYWGRWIAHNAARLEYERAYLLAVGGGELIERAEGKIKIEKGGAIRADGYPLTAGVCYWVTRVNPNTIEVYNPRDGFMKFPKVERSRILEQLTAKEANEKAKESEILEAMRPPAGETPKTVFARRMAEQEAARVARNAQREAA